MGEEKASQRSTTSEWRERREGRRTRREEREEEREPWRRRGAVGRRRAGRAVTAVHQQATRRRAQRSSRPSVLSATWRRRVGHISKGLTSGACSEEGAEPRKDTRTPRPTRKWRSSGTSKLSSTTSLPQRNTSQEQKWSLLV